MLNLASLLEDSARRHPAGDRGGLDDPSRVSPAAVAGVPHDSHGEGSRRSSSSTTAPRSPRRTSTGKILEREPVAS
jgi:hypothetical protein